MIKITSATLPQRLTIRLILEDALARGWQAYAPLPDSAYATLTRPDGAKLSIFSSCPPTTSNVAAKLSDDKYLTHLMLTEADLPVLQTYRCETDDEARAAAQKIIDARKFFVVKPLDAGHANGITVRLSNQDQLTTSLAYAHTFSPVVIVQEYQEQPIDLRILCIDYAVVAILERIPARVVGDGTHTIAELIMLQNQDRGAQYTSDLSLIPIERVQTFLGDAINDIPADQEMVPVLGTANIGMGGESRDVTDDVPQWLKDMAVSAAKTMQLPVCGVDFLISTDPTSDASREELQPSITEINKCPSLFIHDRPLHGQSRPATAAYVDYLARIMPKQV